MDEIQDIVAKYDRAYRARLAASTPEADQLALTFYEDVAEILDILSRLKNVERNPTGFSIDDAPILGLLVRTWKRGAARPTATTVIRARTRPARGCPVSAPFRKCTKTAVVEMLVTSWHLLRYLFDSLSSSPPDGFGRALHPPCARHFQTDRIPTISRRR